MNKETIKQFLMMQHDLHHGFLHAEPIVHELLITIAESIEFVVVF